jgi:hypothetical protein
MKNLTEEIQSPTPHAASPALTANEIRRTLTTILESAPFRSSPQIQKVLTFLVLETLAGSGESLKERVIGASLFDRRPDYDTNSDPIVRLRVSEVRKRLALYYQGARDETVLIRIPSGSFKAVFEWSDKKAAAVEATDAAREPEPMLLPAEPVIRQDESETSGRDGKRFSGRLRWIAALASVAIACVAAVHYVPSAEERAFSKFWAPILENSNTVLIGLGNNPLYELSNAGEDEYYKTHPKDRFEEMGLHPSIPLSPGSPIDSKYINPAANTYLTIGDVGALSNIQYVLGQRRIKFDLRFVNDLSFGDLRQNPTILIGVHNNIWTLNMTENLRFGFQGHSTIVDRFDPHKVWTANADRSETYGVVARLLNSSNGKVVMVIGGVGYSGTRAAGDFISNPASVLKMAKLLPKNWETKNVEVVLHTSVKDQIPGPCDIVGIYAW